MELLIIRRISKYNFIEISSLRERYLKFNTYNFIFKIARSSVRDSFEKKSS